VLRNASPRADTRNVEPRDPTIVLGAVRLALRPGRTFVARVERVGDGWAVVNLAGEPLRVALDGAALRPGETVRLAVRAVEGGRVALQLRTGD
jgi:hypothetical protein